MKITDAVLYQDKLDREQQRKEQEIRAREYATLDKRTTTTHSQIPNMTDAYAEVRKRGGDYPDEYKDFIRRTSGRPV